MRPVPFKCVREVSSEDNVHKAENLLHLQAGRKWKTKLVGEKSAFVILELQETVHITGIDIGNEHSAFVEVYAAKSENARNDFLEVLTTCSFMTPIESKNSTTTNRVRCFGKNSLVESSINTKWQLIKVICTQPFNKFVQFGLAFIKVYTESDPKGCEVFDTVDKINSAKKSYTNPLVLGKFTLREDSPDSENERFDSMFQRWKVDRNRAPDKVSSIAISAGNPISTTGASGTSSKQVARVQKTGSCALEINSSRRNLLCEDGDDTQLPHLETINSEQPSVKRQKLSKTRNEEEERRESEINKNDLKNTETKTEKANDCIVGKLISSGENESHRKPKFSFNHKAVEITMPGNTRFRPFNQLLRGAVIVVSGIQNPDRADLRSKALAMGAVYKSDWKSGCTHLICAFKNTPKYNQVTGKGKIVTRNWIESCYSSRRYLPWRRFALDSAELAKPESDEEIWEKSQRVPECKTDEDNNLGTRQNSEREKLIYKGEGSSGESRLKDSSGSDTDDEIQAAIQSTSREGSEVIKKKRCTNTNAGICKASADDLPNSAINNLRKDISNGEEILRATEGGNVLRENEAHKQESFTNVNENSKDSIKKESIYEVLTEEEDFLSLKNDMRHRLAERRN